MGSPDYSDGTMLALYPDTATAEALAVPGGLPVDELHCTIAYTGTVDEVDERRLRAAAEMVLQRQPIVATISGHARFTGGDDADVVVALVDSTAIEQLRRDLSDALQAQGVATASQHGFTAHISLSYVEPGGDSPISRLAPRPVTFTALSVVYGTEREDLPFDLGIGPTPAELAREAYITGWAAASGPVTERVKAGCIAAAELAEADPGDPAVIEAALHLGHLEGVWAAIFDRRDRLHADTLAAVMKVWRSLVRAVDTAALIQAVRQDTDATSRPDRAVLTALATSHALTALRSLLGADRWPDLRRAVRDGLAAAHAEGQANAAALAADTDGHLGFDHDTAHADAAGAIGDPNHLWSTADVVLAGMLAATAGRIGRRLTRAALDGDAEGLVKLAAVDALVEPPDVAVELAHTIDATFASSMWDLYRRAGLDQIDLVTAGDGNVDQQCRDAEEAGPYSLFNTPILPLHYGCRCIAVARQALPTHLYADYLPGS